MAKKDKKTYWETHQPFKWWWKLDKMLQDKKIPIWQWPITFLYQTGLIFDSILRNPFKVFVWLLVFPLLAFTIDLFTKYCVVCSETHFFDTVLGFYESIVWWVWGKTGL